MLVKHKLADKFIILIKQKSKNAIKLLNEAVNQLERGDVVLMKTLVKLNYLERMETKRKYEKTYETVLFIVFFFNYIKVM